MRYSDQSPDPGSVHQTNLGLVVEGGGGRRVDSRDVEGRGRLAVPGDDRG